MFKKWLICYNDHSLENEVNVFSMTLNDVNGVSLIALHCSHKCVALNTVFQSGWQMCHISIVLFIWYICWGTYMQRSVSKMTCLFFGNRESYICFNKQVEIYTSHLVLLHINSCTQISCFWNKWLITETLVFVWNCVISNEWWSTEIKGWLSIKPVLSLSNSFWTRVHTVVECFVQRACDFSLHGLIYNDTQSLYHSTSSLLSQMFSLYLIHISPCCLF